MIKFLIQHAKWIVVSIGVFFFVLTQTNLLQNTAPWQKIEGMLIDRQYTWRGAKAPHPDIRLVGLQGSSMSLDSLAPEEIAASESLQLMKEPYPWDRRVYAAVLEKLMNAGAKVVMFDFVFAGAREGDEVFAAALKKYQEHVVIGSMFAEDQDSLAKKYTPPNQRLISADTKEIVGLVNLWPDDDGVTRCVRYRTSIEREDIRMKKLGMTNYADNLVHITLRAVEKFGEKVSPPPPNEISYIDFQGSRGTYPVLPVEYLFVDKVWKAPPFNGGTTFSNKIVVVGPIAEIFHDRHQTPFGDTPGPEVQAQLIGSLLRRSFIRPSMRATDLALELTMVALALAVCLRVGNAMLKVILMIGAAMIFLGVCQIVFTRGNLLVGMMSPLFCLVATGSFGVTFQFAIEQFERLRTRLALERYVSENVAKTILEDQRDFEERKKGRKKSVTVLFSDIRGFTSLTENFEAEKLVAQLNEYLLEMVGIVRQEGGTLSKYIGDAIMAVWGDTHSEGAAQDAQRALRAALQMRPMLAKLNAGWKHNPDRREISIGIGVNHDKVIVGEIGHPKRTEFAVLGDGVNLAARLESATKQFHTDILIGETLEVLTREQFIYRRVDLLAVMGKTRPVEVFGLLSDRSQPEPLWLARYHEAIRLYRERQFDRAGELFKEVLQEIGGPDFLCDMYIARCAAYHAAPPPPNWSGAFMLTEK